MKRSLAKSAGVLIVLLALAACSDKDSSAGDASKEPDLGAIAQRVATDDVAFPLDAYRLTDEQRTSVARARAGLAASCMKRFGFDIQPPPMSTPSRVGGPNSRVYGIGSLERAQTYGFHLMESEKKEPHKQEEVSPAAVSVMTGKGQASSNGQEIPEGGCLGEAARLIRKGGPAVADDDYAGALALEASQRAKKDSRLLKAFSDWSACMRDRGFNYRNPSDPENDRALIAGAEVTGQEISVAVADVECKKTTNVVGVWFAVDTAYQKQAMEQHASELQKAKETIDAMVRNAGGQ
ncbi:hypothetical protein [Kitasatospora purpeofusca]|uniref:hypothetical protein n=1 Tax=Kitasatospora purpeofusca TaxID=67352 RepID=UPI00386E2C52|nr:hypothetical protein OIP63_09060 [Kitasatospora purpeofusca]